jgi:hypothetical protein
LAAVHIERELRMRERKGSHTCLSVLAFFSSQRSQPQRWLRPRRISRDCGSRITIAACRSGAAMWSCVQTITTLNLRSKHQFPMTRLTRGTRSRSIRPTEEPRYRWERTETNSTQRSPGRARALCSKSRNTKVAAFSAQPRCGRSLRTARHCTGSGSALMASSRLFSISASSAHPSKRTRQRDRMVQMGWQ